MRTISLATLSQLYAQESQVPLLSFVTITHPQLQTPLRFVNDYRAAGAPYTLNGAQYLWFPFDCTFPLDRADQPPQAKLIADATDLSIVTAIRAVPVTPPPNFQLQLILSSYAENGVLTNPPIEASFLFTVRQIIYDAHTVQATLMYELFLDEPFPGIYFVPSSTPGLFQ